MSSFLLWESRVDTARLDADFNADSNSFIENELSTSEARIGQNVKNNCVTV